MFNNRYILYFAAAGLISGCANTDPEISMKPPVYVEQMPSKPQPSGITSAGSLYGRGENPLFSDRKAMNVNDILTVVINENTNQSSKANKSTSQDTNLGLGGGTFTGDSKVARELNRVGQFGFNAGSKNSYKGGGSNSRNENFRTTISARIIKVLNNGNYFIQGSRELLINGDKQIIELSGVIRPYDISQNNEIDSKYIADAKILYKTEGDIDKATSKGWGTKFFETIWPF